MYICSHMCKNYAYALWSSIGGWAPVFASRPTTTTWQWQAALSSSYHRSTPPLATAPASVFRIYMQFFFIFYVCSLSSPAFISFAVFICTVVGIKIAPSIGKSDSCIYSQRFLILIVNTLGRMCFLVLTTHELKDRKHKLYSDLFCFS